MSSRISRLARFLEAKYQFRSITAAESYFVITPLLREVKSNILDVYRNYFSRSARDSMFQFAADAEDPLAIELTFKMDTLVKNIDNLSVQELAKSINVLLNIMLAMKGDANKSTRQAISDVLPGRTQSQRDARERALVKYERSLSYSFSALQKIVNKLQAEAPGVKPVEGDISRQRGELTKQQLLDFLLSSPLFANHNLSSLDIMEAITSDPDLKDKLTTLINTVKRGHDPKNAPYITNLVKEIANRITRNTEVISPNE